MKALCVLALHVAPVACIIGDHGPIVDRTPHAILRSSATLLGAGSPSEADYHLRVCSAYDVPGGLDIYGLRSDKMTQKPLGFKECRDFMAPLAEGSGLSFRNGGQEVALFAVRRLPMAGSSLLLIARRRDAKSSAVAFSSHTFASSQVAQIAVVDALGQPAGDFVRIEKGSGPYSNSKQWQKLDFNTIIAVKPGEYKVALMGENKLPKTSLLQIKAQSKENYIVMRVGNVGKGSEAPQDIVVFPQMGGTQKTTASLAIIFITTAAALLSDSAGD